LDEFKRLLDSDAYDFRYDIGIGLLSSSIKSTSDQMQIIDSMSKNYSVLNVKAELDQILCGLSSTLNMLYVIREYPKMFRPLLIYSQVERISGDMIYKLFKAVLSPDGSNRRDSEELVLMWWADLIYHIEGISL
jgi:hypothetical protein